ncbi:hypothetical protein C1I95_20375 [Micromonospora craterilacus]|uniref:Uncharacterized protein n=1 Tax=Micromonospora craterilacus TaxID=1655439 RepID=A0A2W2DT13_9ACTN|nr:hypothetical protein [Micromonospora craterilacus]PZG15066.1 hypothetical protein C1I95_20375 [Micromonospora craterilacus]
MTTNLQAAPEQVSDGSAPGAVLEDEPRSWWFTFPDGSAYAGRYAVTHGTHDAAMAEVTAHFGPTIAGQFASSEEARVAHLGLMRLRRDQWPAPVVEQTAAPAGDDSVVNPGGLVEQAATGEWRRPGDADTAVLQAVAADDETAAGGHRMASFWKGDEPGESGAACACGLTFDGFDSLDRASELLDRHIAAENQSAPPPVPAGELQPGMWVATGDVDAPGIEVRYVEQSEDGRWVGVVFAGPSYAEYPIDVPLYLVDEELVEQAAARARARAHRAQQIECLRRLAQLAEEDEHFPLPRYTLRIGGGLDSPEAVRRVAAVLDVEVTKSDYGLRATWRYGGADELNPPVEVEMSAAHPRSGDAKSTPVPVPVSPAAPAAGAATLDSLRRCRRCGATTGLAMSPHDPVEYECADATCPQAGAR